MEIIKNFGKASALLINEEKTSGMNFETPRHRGTNANIRWKKEITILGNTINRKQWDEAMKNINEIMKDVEAMHLPRHEKIEIIRTIHLPSYNLEDAQRPRGQVKKETSILSI